MEKANDLVCIESRDPLTDIVIANLALAAGADLRWIELPAALAERIDSEDEFVRSSSRAPRVTRAVRDELERHHRELDLHSYRTVTIVTKATPHGLVTPPTVTTAHLLHIADLAHALVDIMLYETWETSRTYTAIICDPGFFRGSETEPVSRLLENAGWKVRRLEGTAASYDAFDAHVKFFPHDFLMIAAHGGRVEGQYQVWELRDAR